MRRRTLMGLLVIALLPTILVNCISVISLGKTVTSLQEKNLKNGAILLAGHLSTDFEEKYAMVQNAAKEEAYIDLLKQANTEVESENYQDLYDKARAQMNRNSNDISGGSLVGHSGKILVSQDESFEGLMINKTQVYSSILQGLEIYKDIAVSENSAALIEVAVPIKDLNGEILGVLIKIIDSKSISFHRDFADNIELDICLFGPKGVLNLYNGQINTIGFHAEFQNLENLDALVSDFRNNKLEESNGHIEYRYKGQNYVGGYAKIQGTDLLVLASSSVDTFLGAAASTSIITLIASLMLVVVLMILAYYLWLKDLISSFTYLNNKIKKMARGDLSFNNIPQLTGEFKEINGTLDRLNEKYKRVEKELRLSTRLDSLTGLANRVAIYEQLDTLLYTDSNQALLTIKIGGLSAINDCFGYDVGDKVLIEVGAILRSLQQDTCHLARISGDKILIFLTGWREERYPEKIADFLLNDIQRIRFIGDIHVDISINIGIVYVTDERMDKEKLILNSNTAMKMARNRGKSTYMVYFPDNAEEKKV